MATNCTGRVTIDFTGGKSVSANFVLDNSNKGFQIIDTTDGTLAAGFGMARGAVTCGMTRKKETFAAVAQVILDGTGRVSGTGTFDVNGILVKTAITGYIYRR